MNDVFAEHRNSLIILTCWHGSIAAGTPSALRRYLLCCHHVPIIPALQRTLHMFWYSLRNCIAPWWLGAESSFRNIKSASGHVTHKMRSSGGNLLRARAEWGAGWSRSSASASEQDTSWTWVRWLWQREGPSQMDRRPLTHVFQTHVLGWAWI